MSQTETDGPLYRRWWKVWPFPRCCLPCNSVLHPCRASVSQNKRRFQKDGFDLDLSYVTGRIIVHGFPATGVEHIYRNPRLEVQRLLDKYHESKYKVYNFASEPGRTYPEQLFHGRVERYPFADHTCPPLESVVDFCENAKAWLDTHEDNVVSLHCKAGKGRAGIMAACLMVRLGDTASAAVSKFDKTRVSDSKGLTMVNQRKWPFLYERLVRELWGIQDSIGVVPGQDPDLGAPAVRVACVREISIQLQPKTKGGKKNDKILPSLSCAIFQQEPMGKTLVHRAKMVPSAPEDGYSGSVYAAALPRSAVVQGTFQVLITSALGAAATQKHIIDLWWTTTFLAPEGGDHAFALAEMDVFSLKLATRLQEAGARVILRHTHPHAASPRRHSALKHLPAGSKTANPEEAGDGEDGEGVGSAQGEGTSEQAVPAPAAPAAPAPDSKAGGEPRQEATDPSLAKTAAEKSDNATTTTTDASEGVRDAQEQSGEVDSAAGSSSQTERAAGAETYIATARNSDVATGQKSARAAPVMHKQAPSIGGPSPAFPGPSPAGLVSPVWTFEGRTPSVRDDPAGRAIEDSRWTRSKMWNSNPGVSSGGASTPTAAVSVKSVAPAADRGTGLRAKRRTAQRQRSRSDSIGSSQSGMHSAMSGGSGPVRVGGAWSAVYGGDSGRGESGDKSSSVEGQGQGRQREKGLAFHGHHRHRETDSDSDDQLAVRASAFGMSSTASGGGGGGSGGGGQIAVAQFVPQGPPTGTSSTQGEQWAMEMEMSFAQERRGWEEHRHCLETELDWALAARARAEARSEEDNARVEVLENRLSAWRSEYSMIERDVKHAVKLLEMSLSGLMSAENALKRWKTHIPPKAYEDIMACLTKGEMAHKPAASEQE